MQYVSSIQPTRPQVRVRRDDPEVLAIRRLLTTMSDASFRELDRELNDFVLYGLEGDALRDFVGRI